MGEERTIVEYFAEHEGYRCGYCKSPDTNYSHGLWAHSMSVQNYEQLLNRGWRRSGSYMYKPTNSITCCPMYTISCHALDFNISKSQKKVIKKFNAFLRSGTVPKNQNPNNGEDLKGLDEKIEMKKSKVASLDEIQIDEIPSSKPQPQEEEEKQPQMDIIIKDEEKIVNVNANNTKSKCKKAKFLRLERRKQKLLSKGMEIEFKSKNDNNKKSLEELLNEEEEVGKKLTVKYVRLGSLEFTESLDKEHELYEKYQMKVHNDTKDDCNRKQYKRFLCSSPLTSQDDRYGSYHHQYWIGDRLIAVGVVDILPSCLSSVYFFYDPDLMCLSLGTFGALYEISIVRKLSKTLENFRFYYMGFYIHSCQKMRYKGNFYPSYLLCNEGYSWHLLEDKLRKILDANKYARFDDGKEHQPVVNEPIESVQVLFRRCILTYEIYKLHRLVNDDDVIQQYVNLVGGTNAKNMFLYRSSS